MCSNNSSAKSGGAEGRVDYGGMGIKKKGGVGFQNRRMCNKLLTLFHIIFSLHPYLRVIK